MATMSAPPMAAAIAVAARAGRALAGAASTLSAPLLAFALPQRCPGCGSGAEPERVLCAACLAAIPPLASPLCARCLVRGREPSGCRRHARHEVWAARIYDERAARLVHAFKYDARPAVAGVMAEQIAAALPPRLAPDLVTQAPLHAARRRERGFDQAATLAAALAERLAAPFLPDLLRRVRATRPQVGLSERARRENLAGAFVVAHPGRLAGRSVLVVDDVLTTGATLDACLETLADAGAHGVGAAFAWAE